MIFFFIFNQILKIYRTICVQTMETLIRRRVASGLGLNCLPMSHKKDDMCIWVNGIKVHI